MQSLLFGQVSGFCGEVGILYATLSSSNVFSDVLQVGDGAGQTVLRSTQVCTGCTDGSDCSVDCGDRVIDVAHGRGAGSTGQNCSTATNSEFAQMSDEITRISASTNLNGKNLLDGSAGTMQLQVGANTGSANRIDLVLSSKFDAVSLSVGSGTVVLTGATSATLSANIDNAITAIDAALASINATRANLGASQNRLTSTISNLQNIVENTTAAQGRVQDTDFAAETANLTKQQTLQQASTSVLAQANQLPSAVLKLLQ